MLNESWELKNKFYNKISNNKISEMMKIIKSYKNCAVKLCGSGGGGFILATYPNNNLKRKFLDQLKNPYYFDLKISLSGTELFQIT